MVKALLRKRSEKKENIPLQELRQNHLEKVQNNPPPAKKSTMKKIRGALRRILGIQKKSKDQDEHYEETELDIPLALPPSNPHLTPPANTSSPKPSTRQTAEAKSGPNSVQQAIEEEVRAFKSLSFAPYLLFDSVRLLHIRHMKKIFNLRI